MSKIRLRIQEIYMLMCIYVSKAMGIFLKKNHWVIVERGNDARDNAYCFYLFMKREHPEKKVYYIIDKKSADFEKVKQDAVSIGSFKSFLVLTTAERLITTHYGSGMKHRSNKLFSLMKLSDKVCFLQHGITYNEQRGLFRDSAPMRLFFCGAKPEYEYVKRVFGHPEGTVKYTGFARFDRLHDAEIMKRILVMPTWRTYIKDEKTFLESEYYARFQGLINDRRLIRLLEGSGTELVLYVHYELQQYIHNFKSESKNVTVASFVQYDVQELLKNSALLITDYSSVFFDFAYMRKPVLYYQFDFEEFFAKHYIRGEFSYENDGFGGVYKEKDALIDAIAEIAQNDMRPQEKYLDRMKAYFPLYDQCNCQRIYEEILKS